MKDLNAFCIGSYCENILEELHKYEHGEACDENIINLAIKPVKFFLNYINLMKDFNDSLVSVLMPDEFTASITATIIIMFQGKSETEIKERFEDVEDVLNSIKDDLQVDVRPAVEFFTDIADLNRIEPQIYLIGQ